MKIRTGFVSNSSTASFILRKSSLTRKLSDTLKNLEKNEWWMLSFEETYVYGGVTMDNDGIKSIFIDNGLKEYKDFYVTDQYEPIPVTTKNLEEFFAEEINVNRDINFDKEKFCEEHSLRMYEMIIFGIL